jgi:hypothetical protein
MKTFAIMLAQFVVLVAAANASAVPLSLRSLGPLSLNLHEKQVEAILGRPGTPCKIWHSDRVCYTDGTSLLVVTYDDRDVVGIGVQEKLDASTQASAKIRYRLSTWLWNGTPVFAPTFPVRPPVWSTTETGPRSVDYQSGGYGFEKTYSPQDGWTADIGEDSSD